MQQGSDFSSVVRREEGVADEGLGGGLKEGPIRTE
jgi:hypothetical protein